MQSLFRSSIRITWVRNGAYTLRLVSDLTGEQWIAQPVPGRVMNHPAWILCHLNVYAAVVGRLLRAQQVDDPLGTSFARNSAVSNQLGDHPPPSRIVADYTRLHDEALQGLDSAADTVFETENPIPRWRTLHPRIGEQLVTLMVKHESFHLGQLSAWRRSMGMAPVEM